MIVHQHFITGWL